jgi:ribokinase
MASVIVVGSVNMDLVVRVPNLPGSGETVAGGTFARALGGKGANQAAAAAKLGARVWLVGLTGHDDFGREARVDLEDRGVDISTLGTAPSPTGVAAIMVDDSGENMIAVASGANHDLTGELVAERLMEVAADDAVLLANLEVPDGAVEAAATVAVQRGWTFVLNPAPARPLPDGLIARCDVLTPNEGESLVVGSVENLLALGAGAVVVTRGASGADVLRAGARTLHREALPVDVVDTTGAGDAFNGALAWSLSEGHDLDESVRLAVAAGGLACRALGARASLPDRRELEGALPHPHDRAATAAQE